MPSSGCHHGRDWSCVALTKALLLLLVGAGAGLSAGTWFCEGGTPFFTEVGGYGGGHRRPGPESKDEGRGREEGGDRGALPGRKGEGGGKGKGEEDGDGDGDGVGVGGGGGDGTVKEAASLPVLRIAPSSSPFSSSSKLESGGAREQKQKEQPPPPQPQPTSFSRKPTAIPLHRVQGLLTDVEGSTGFRYGLKDSRGVGMDCLRIIYAPLHGIRRYLGVYHHYQNDIKTFQVFLAQSFDLITWEFLRRLISNADMPAVTVDSRTGRVLLVYEHFLSAKERWPCAVGIRLYSSVDTFVSGRPLATFVAPNTVSRIEGTPNIYAFDATAGTAEIGFHFQNETLVRDEVGRGTLSGFPGTPVWTASADLHYNQVMTSKGVTGNVGGRDVLEINGGQHHLVICEGNVQPPPAHPTVWDAWRVWLWEDNRTVAQLNVRTHKGSVAVANPSMALVPSPKTGRPAVFATYFIFSEGAAKGEAGQLAFYSEI